MEGELTPALTQSSAGNFTQTVLRSHLLSCNELNTNRSTFKIFFPHVPYHINTHWLFLILPWNHPRSFIQDLSQVTEGTLENYFSQVLFLIISWLPCCFTCEKCLSCTNVPNGVQIFKNVLWARWRPKSKLLDDVGGWGLFVWDFFEVVFVVCLFLLVGWFWFCGLGGFDSQNNRICWAGRDLSGSLSWTPGPAQVLWSLPWRTCSWTWTCSCAQPPSRCKTFS